MKSTGVLRNSPGLQQAKDAEKDQYEVQLATIRTEMQEVKDQLTSENMVLGGKLASLEEFKVQKEDLMAKFAKLEKELESNKVEHEDVIYNLERKAVVDKDRFDIFHFKKYPHLPPQRNVVLSLAHHGTFYYYLEFIAPPPPPLNGRGGKEF